MKRKMETSETTIPIERVKQAKSRQEYKRIIIDESDNYNSFFDIPEKDATFSLEDCLYKEDLDEIPEEERASTLEEMKVFFKGKQIKWERIDEHYCWFS